MRFTKCDGCSAVIKDGKVSLEYWATRDYLHKDLCPKCGKSFITFLRKRSGTKVDEKVSV